jgi:large subunit ribosomal protein L1
LPIAKENVLAAVEEMKKSSIKRQFKQSVELVLKLKDIDLKKPQSRLNESIQLPNALGKNVKVAFIAGGDLALRAKNAGADVVVGREDLERMAKEKKEARKLSRSYDQFVAEAPLMPLIGKTIGQVLGPKGKMPTPVAPNVAVDELIARQRKTTKLRLRDQPVASCRVATEDMTSEQIAENIQAVIAVAEGKLERGSKNISEILVKTTMGKPVKIAA